MTFSLIYSFKLAHNGNFDGKYGQKPPYIIPWLHKKVQVGKDQEKAQSEKDSHSKNQGGKKPN